MDLVSEIKTILGDVLQIRERAAGFSESTRLLGDIPEFDSMAVVSVITAIEEQFGIVVNDDEVRADTFETVGSLAGFVREKLG